MRKLLIIGLLVAICGAGLAAVITAAQDGDLVPVAYLPVITHDYAPPVPFNAHAAGSWHFLAQGANLPDALAGDDVILWRYDHTLRAVNLPPDALRPRYGIERGCAVFDLAAAPPGIILTATLELYVLGQSDLQGDFVVRFHRGAWTEPPTAADWNRYDALLGTYDTAGWQQARPIWVPLPGLVGEPVPERLYLVLRGDEEAELPAGQDSHTACFALDLFDGTNYVPASRLHLLIGGTP